MHEDYITYEQAVKLKELGFDWKVTQFYVERSNYRNKPFLYYNGEYLEMLGGLDGVVLIEDLIKDNNHVNDDFSAPTLAQAQKWLREVKKIHIIVNIDRWLTTTPYRFEIYREVGESIIHQYTQNDFPTYEEALSAGIDKALELLKEK